MANRTDTFEKESDGRWFIVLPKFPLHHDNLEMVEGADTLLDKLANGGTKVTVQMTTDLEVAVSEGLIADWFTISRRKIHKLGLAGSTYEVLSSKPALKGHILWLCPVTLYVFGYYPKKVYIRVIK